MNLLCLSDLHGDESALRRIIAEVESVDMVALAGDLTHFGTPNQAEHLIKAASDAGCPVLAVAGNCDSALIDQRLSELEVSPVQHGIRIHDAGFYGLSAMPPWTGHMYELTEPEIAQVLQQGHEAIADAPRRILIAHPPPRDCALDRTRLGCHVGSRSLRDHIEQCQPDVVICGHIHEARGADTIGPTHVVNCGPAFKGFFAVVRLDPSVEIDLRRI